MNNKTRAKEHLLPPSKEGDKGAKSRRDPAFDLLILAHSAKTEPKLTVKISIFLTGELQVQKCGVNKSRTQRYTSRVKILENS